MLLLCESGSQNNNALKGDCKHIYRTIREGAALSCYQPEEEFIAPVVLFNNSNPYQFKP
jgi:hypothetical protein